MFSIIKKIKKRAEQAGMTVGEVEIKASIGKQTIRRWDDHSPSIDKVARVAQVLGCTVDELIADADEVEDATVSA